MSGMSWINELAAGAVSGGAAVLVSHPLDTVRVRQQVVASKATEAVRTLIRSDGWRGFYRGVSPPLVMSPIISASTFFAWGAARRTIESSRIAESPLLSSSSTRNALAGAAAGVVQTIVVNPFDFAKVRLQTTTTGATKLSPVRFVANLVRTEGISAFYSGFTASLLRRIPANAVYFGTYEAAKGVLEKSWGAPGIAVAGALGGVTSWILTYPLDVLKTRQQTDSAKNGILGILRQGLRTEGTRFLFRGLPVTLLRSVPMHSTMLVTFETTVHILNDFGSPMGSAATCA